MNIAVAYDNGNIFQHFGHTEKFKIYNIENGLAVSSKIVDTNGQGHGALAGFLKEENIDVLICGGIGAGAKNALTQAGITLRGGCFGSCDKAVSDYLLGTLLFNPNVQCNHHSSDHHSCSEHHCK